jgi:hypothetical protein
MKSAPGKFYLALFIVCSAWIGWFRDKNGLDAPSALACAAAMLVAGVTIYELAEPMRHKTLTGLQYIGLVIAMLAAWYALAVAAGGPSNSIDFVPNSGRSGS